LFAVNRCISLFESGVAFSRYSPVNNRLKPL
jgi:hypothetical protein